MAGRPKGRPKTGGRTKGTPNQVTRTVKAALEVAFDKVGGPEYLARMAEEQPAAFMTLLGKVIPNQVEAKVDMQPGYVFKIETVSDDDGQADNA